MNPALNTIVLTLFFSLSVTAAFALRHSAWPWEMM
jgi:hypothetical protein